VWTARLRKKLLSKFVTKPIATLRLVSVWPTARSVLRLTTQSVRRTAMMLLMASIYEVRGISAVRRNREVQGSDYCVDTHSPVRTRTGVHTFAHACTHTHTIYHFSLQRNNSNFFRKGIYGLKCHAFTAEFRLNQYSTGGHSSLATADQCSCFTCKTNWSY